MKHTITGFIHWEKPYLKDDHGFVFYQCDMTKHNYVMVKPHSFEVEIPDNFDPRPAQIKALEKQQRQAAADFHKLNTQLMRQIQELQALEMTA